MTQDSQHLRQILDKIGEIARSGGRSLAVFDLDSTLFDVGPRLQRILEDFAKLPDHQARFPDQLRHFDQIKVLPGDWGIKDALLRTGMADAPEEFLEAVRHYWRTHFFSNDGLEHDIPYPGAVDFVRRLHELGADIVYLTGRDVHRMGTGSAKVLEKWKFPLDPKARLELKPDRRMDDALFKADWFLALPERHYEHIWFFENEPVNIHALRPKAPHVAIVFFASTHSRMAEPPTDLPVISHFVIPEDQD